MEGRPAPWLSRAPARLDATELSCYRFELAPASEA